MSDGRDKVISSVKQLICYFATYSTIGTIINSTYSNNISLSKVIPFQSPFPSPSDTTKAVTLVCTGVIDSKPNMVANVIDQSFL